MGMKMTIEDLIRKYELRCQKLEAGMPERERWGHGPHDKHELALCQEFVAEMKRLDMEPEMDAKTKASWIRVKDLIKKLSEEVGL